MFEEVMTDLVDSPYIVFILTALVLAATYLGIFISKISSLKQQLTKKTDYQKPDLQNRFSKSKLQSKYDYVIIGSGTSGLSSASTLSKLGKKVLVLEQHDRIGGCFHTFNEKGYEFDTGFHYVGNASMFKAIVSMLGSKKVEWTTHQHFDNVQIGDYIFKMEAPIKTFIQNLHDEFPEEKEVLNKYFGLRRAANEFMMAHVTCSALPQFLQFFYRKYIQFKYSKLYGKSTRQVFDEIGISKNKKLESVLAGISGDLGTYLTELDFSMHVGLLGHYNSKGSMYPKESTNAIIDSIAGTIVSRGGTLLTKAKVEKILVENGKCEGVELRGGVKVQCKNVISTMGIPNTLESLPEQYRWKNNSIYDDAFNLYSLFLGINTEGMTEKVPTYNTWYTPKKKDEEYLSYDESTKRFMETQKNEYRPIFVSFGTAKQGKETNKHAVSVLSPCKWSWVEKYRVNEVRREKEYEEFKLKLQEELKEKFLDLYPQFKDRIEYINLGTPLTYETYYNRKTPYGTQLNMEKMYDTETFFKTKTSIKGLHLSGQDLTYPGFIGSLITGVLTSIRATGYI